LRGRGEREIPEMLAQALRERDVPASAIEVIPDEQAAIDAALRMGRPGDLLLVFADALTRSWKQIIKFKPQPDVDATAPYRTLNAPPPHNIAPPPTADEAASDARDDAALEAQGFVREERGLRFIGEAAD
jgi:cyanophycin synthetase